MEKLNNCESNLNLDETELRLGLPGTKESEKFTNLRTNKRALLDMNKECGSDNDSTTCSGSQEKADQECAPAAKAQVVGWPPIRSYRKSHLQPKKTEAEVVGIYVKVSMDGAPYLRKIDLKVYKGYPELLKALEAMFKFNIGHYSEREEYNGAEYVPTYEDKDGDWMLVGDVPWDMFISSCKRLRIMKGSEARGLGCGS